MDISARIAQLATQRGLSQAELARRAGIRADTLNRRLKGKLGIPAKDREAIARVLDVSVSDLEGRKPAPGLVRPKPIGIPVVNAAPSGRAISFPS